MGSSSRRQGPAQGGPGLQHWRCRPQLSHLIGCCPAHFTPLPPPACSGVCGAALYISAHIHGFRRTKRDVVAVVHIGEHTLSRRLYEFAATPVSDLTAIEFEKHANDVEKQQKLALEEAPPLERPVGMLGYGCDHMSEWAGRRRQGDREFGVAWRGSWGGRVGLRLQP